MSPRTSIRRSPRLDSTFMALADPTRRAIVRRLARGEACVGELAKPFRMSLPAVSKHLSVLESAGLVARRREGRTIHVSLDPKPLSEAVGWMEEARAFWEQSLDALEALLAEDADPPPGEAPGGAQKRRKSNKK